MSDNAAALIGLGMLQAFGIVILLLVLRALK